MVATAIKEFVAASKVHPSILVLSSQGQEDSNTELTALSTAPPHTPKCDHHGNRPLFDRLVESEPKCFKFISD